MYTNYRLRARKKKLRRLLILLIIIVGVSFVSLRLLSSFFKLPVEGATTAKNQPKQNKDLERLIYPLLDQQNAQYEIAIQNLSNEDDSLYLNSDKPIIAASLYKLYLLAATIRAIEQAEISEDTPLSSDVAHLKEVLGDDDFGYTGSGPTGSGPTESGPEYTISMTVSYTLDRIARVSDNYAAIMLAEKLGWDKVQAEANLDGATNTKITNPITTTASDIAQFLTRLYRREIVSSDASNKLLALLKSSQINDRIPLLLPESIEVAHKTGELSRTRHDAGIVFLPDNPYVIVLMSYDIKGEDDAINTLANVSKAVFDYFQAKAKKV